MKVYISGPISGTSDYMDRFKRVEHLLEGKGYEVVNPAEANAHFPAGTPWEVYMGESLKMLCGCDAICMMKNWLWSRGAKIEYAVATRMDMPIMEEDAL